MIFFDLYVPPRFESGREDVLVPRVTAFREVPKYGGCGSLVFPSRPDAVTSQESRIPSVVLLRNVRAVVSLSGLQGSRVSVTEGQMLIEQETGTRLTAIPMHRILSA